MRPDDFLYGSLLGALVAMSGCSSLSSKPPDPPMYQTEILEMRVEPDPVVAGESAVFTVVIQDSLDSSFQFIWIVEGQAQVETEDPFFQWIADVGVGTYTVLVAADNGDPFKLPPNRSFFVSVAQ